MTRLVFHEVSRSFPGGVDALRDVSFTVESGELLILLGLSGAGKSTLLRLVAGLDSTTGGWIELDGKPIAPLAPHQRCVGFVPQRTVLYPHLTVRDNLRFGLSAPLGVEEVAATFQLVELLDRKPRELSGGELTRVALARLMLRKPRILLLDEPFAHLDAPLRLEIREQLHLLQGHLRATMIVVTHDQDEALSLADRIAVLDRGRLVQLGTPCQLLEHPANETVARLLGSRQIRLIPGVARGRKSPTLISGESRAEGRNVVVGQRPPFLFDADTGQALRSQQRPQRQAPNS